jgi:hypothetical protein
MKRKLITPAGLSLALLMALVACEAQKSSNPLSPSVAGPIPGVSISGPRLIEPAEGARYKEAQQPIRLSVENATTTGVRPLFYTFEVATEAEFTNKMFARSQVAPGDGRTSVTIDRLEAGRRYYWRARAEDGANIGPFTSSLFELLPRPQLGAPRLISPINNQRTGSRRPTLAMGPPDRNASVGALGYDVQVSLDAAFAQIVSSGTVAEDGAQTNYTPASDLPPDRQHYWRARATDGETTSGWSGAQGFVTPAGSSAPPPGPTPNPGPSGGGSCAGHHGPTIVACIAQKYAAWRRPVGSLGERQANMMFLRDRIIEAGKCGGMDLVWNLKRGGPERSIDVIAWRRPDGNMGVDIAFDYDNYGSTLQLTWAEIDLFAVVESYPGVNCNGV